LKKLEIVKLKVENLREVLKFLFMLILALLSGQVYLIYLILIKKVPFYFVIFIGIGLVALYLMIKGAMFVWEEMNKLLEEANE
jgi:hypothetical protein